MLVPAVSTIEVYKHWQLFALESVWLLNVCMRSEKYVHRHHAFSAALIDTFTEFFKMSEVPEK